MKPGYCAVPVTVLAVVATLFPDSFLYDRTAIINGQVWRLATGHMAHFDNLHLFLNLSLAVPAILILERINARATIRLLFAFAPLLGGALLFCDPALLIYGGLSGLTCALLVVVGGHWCRERVTRSAGWLLLAALGLTLATVDLPAIIFTAPFDAETVQRCARAHFLGCVLGGIVWWLGGWRKRRPVAGFRSEIIKNKV